jgi:PrcB C-terminal
MGVTRTTTFAISLTGLTCALLMGCGGGSSNNKASTTAPISTAQPPLAFRTIEQGDDSQLSTVPVDAFTTRVAENSTEYDALWGEHRGSVLAPKPSVDFGQERVVGVFLGQRQTDGYGIEITDVAEVTSSTLQVSYRRIAPSAPVTQTQTKPFHVVAVNRTQGQITFLDTTAQANAVQLTDVHGELVSAASRVGGQTLAFLEDGQTEAREIVDPSALTAAGAAAGATLVLSGDAFSNMAGLTTLTEALRVVSFSLDTTRVTGRLATATIGSILQDGDGQTYEPTGPLAATLLAQPMNTPLFVTGRIDPNHVSVQQAGPGLIVTSFRRTTTIALEVRGGLAGVDDVFAVDDLPRTATTRYRFQLRIQPANDRRGGGALSDADRLNLEALIANADLRNQPTRFRPTVPLLDVPTTFLELADTQGPVRITIEAGASLPSEVDVLVRTLAGFKTQTTYYRNLERGQFSGVSAAATRAARDLGTWQALWGQHAGTGPGVSVPALDFSRELAVGVFLGRKTSGGYGVEVTDLRRVGDDLHLTVVETAPAPGTPTTTVITSPYHFVVVEHMGATGDVWVNGVRQ